MKKFLMPFFMALIVAALAGCADNNNDGGSSVPSSVPSYDLSNIATDEENITTVEATRDTYAWGYMYLTNPRTASGQYYPILLSTSMGIHPSFTATLTSDYNADKLNGDLTFGNDNYDLSSAASMTNSRRYHLAITGQTIPNDGTILIVFLTRDEEEQYLANKAIDQTVINQLNELGALRQYKWTKSAN